MSIQNKKDNATQLTGHVSEEEINQAFSVHTCMRYREREREKKRGHQSTRACMWGGVGVSYIYIYIHVLLKRQLPKQENTIWSVEEFREIPSAHEGGPGTKVIYRHEPMSCLLGKGYFQSRKLPCGGNSQMGQKFPKAARSMADLQGNI